MGEVLYDNDWKELRGRTVTILSLDDRYLISGHLLAVKYGECLAEIQRLESDESIVAGLKENAILGRSRKKIF